MDDATLAKHLLLDKDILYDDQVFKFIVEAYEIERDMASTYSAPMSYDTQTNYIVRATYQYADTKNNNDLIHLANNVDKFSGASYFLCFVEQDLLDYEPEGDYYIYNGKYVSKNMFHLNPIFEYSKRVLVTEKSYQSFNDDFSMLPTREIFIPRFKTQFGGPQKMIQKFVNTESFYLLYKKEL